MKKKTHLINIEAINKPQSLNENDIFTFVKGELLKGNANPEKAFLWFRAIKEAFEMLKEDEQTKSIFETAFLRYGKQGKKHNVLGFGVTVTHKKYYDYDATGSHYYQHLKDVAKVAADNVKQYEKFLQTLDVETTNEYEQGAILKPITHKTKRIITVGEPVKEAA